MSTREDKLDTTLPQRWWRKGFAIAIIFRLLSLDTDDGPVRRAHAEEKPATAPATDSKESAPAQASTKPSALERALLTNPLQTRSPESLQALFKKGEATGLELLEEIKAIRQAVVQRNLAEASGQLLGTLEQAALNPAQALQGGNALRRILENWGDKAMEAASKYLLAQISYAALEEFFERFSDDPEVLKKVKVRLPEGKNLSQVHKQQVVTLAGFVAAVQGARLIAKAAQKDFDQLEVGYQELMARRLEASKLFAEAMRVARGRELELKEYEAMAPALDSADVAYLKAFPTDRLLKDFATDFRAQNLALRYLRAKNPEAFAQYQLKAEKFVGNFQAYTRAVAGAASAGGFSFMFVTNAKSLWKSQGLDSIATLGNLGRDWAEGTIALYKELTPSLLDSLIGRVKGFRVMEGGKVIDKDISAKNVMERIAKAGLSSELRDKLFGSGVDSYLYRVHLCDAAFAAGYLDAAHDVDQRRQFVKGYYGLEQPGADFSFKDAMSGILFPKQSEVLRSDLLARSLSPEDKSARETALREARALTLLKTEDWNTHQLMRILLANHAGTIADPYLTLGKLEIRLVPTKEALYEYETHLQGCTRHATGAAPTKS